MLRKVTPKSAANSLGVKQPFLFCSVIQCNLKIVFILSSVSLAFESGGVNLNTTIGLTTEKPVVKSEEYEAYKANFSYKDSNIKDGLNSYWVKVVQADGHMAWSSPIFVNYK